MILALSQSLGNCMAGGQSFALTIEGYAITIEGYLITIT